LYLTDANVWAEQTKAKWKTLGKKILLGKILFKQTAGALCAGTANKLLYSYYGIPDEKLFPFAYSWGYDKLLQVSSEVRSHRQQYRKDLGIAEDQTVIMFCGRLSEEKGLSNLIEAYGKVASPKTTLMFVGDGSLRRGLEDSVSERQLPSVKFMGFQDRNAIQKFFALSDLLVLPSLRETWGIVVNEGLCFSLPAIVSDEVGAGVDLVQNGRNGFTFPAGDSEALRSCLQRFINLSPEEKLNMGSHSYDLIRQWSERDLSSQLVSCLETIKNGKG
jgi:glycosyltransferase involved in cell wall biosynthesis